MSHPAKNGVMTHNQAIALYFRMSQRARATLDRLTKWDSTKTLANNMTTLNLSNLSSTASFARAYGLRYRRKNASQAIIPIDAGVVRRLLDAGIPEARIAVMYGVRQRAIKSFLRAKNRQPAERSP